MSAAAQKDLNYYLTHADEMPTDPKEIERLANAHMDAAMEAGTEQMDVNKVVGTADEPPGAAAAEKVDVKADEPAKAEVKPAAEVPAADAKPDGILAKDGKNVIPYSQLECARPRAAAAEALARDQAAELATLRASKAAPETVADADVLTEEELSALEADSPTLARTLRAQQAAIRSLRETVEGVKTRQASDVASQEAEVKSEIQTAIDANSTLATWQTSEDQTMWDRASGFDKLLRAMPEYANVSFADRFEKVVEMTQSALGIAPATAPAPQEDQLTPAQIKAAAAAKVAQATKGRKPVSLSDIPGGAPPVVDERQKVEEMSTVSLGQMFLGMTEEQRVAYLASL